MSEPPVVFLDTETTGLEENFHEIWEVGIISFSGETLLHEFIPDSPYVEVSDWVKENTGYLQIAQEFSHLTNDQKLKLQHLTAHRIEAVLEGMHVVCNVPIFDNKFLAKYFRSWQIEPNWHYHMPDVESMVAGRLQIHPPWDSEELSKAIGVDVSKFQRHTALGDAHWTRAMYLKVFES